MHRLAQTTRPASQRKKVKSPDQPPYSTDILIQAATINQCRTQQDERNSTLPAGVGQGVFRRHDFVNQRSLRRIRRVLLGVDTAGRNAYYAAKIGARRNHPGGQRNGPAGKQNVNFAQASNLPDACRSASRIQH
jgi:hypothetical protein